MSTAYAVLRHAHNTIQSLNIISHSPPINSLPIFSSLAFHHLKPSPLPYLSDFAIILITCLTVPRFVICDACVELSQWVSDVFSVVRIIVLLTPRRKPSRSAFPQLLLTACPVPVPYVLTVASFICILIVLLTGITKSSTDISLFKIDTKNFSISGSTLSSIAARGSQDVSELTRLATAGSSTSASTTVNDILSSINVTASDIGLADYYTVTLWTYCGTLGSTTTCSKPQFNWAANATNLTALTDLAQKTAGSSITVPKEVTQALKTFSVSMEWAEILYIIAAVATVIELIVGLFALCSRAGSCFTSCVSGISTTVIVAASILSTVMSSIVIGIINKEGNKYGITAHLETSFLAVTWLAAALSIVAGMFWFISICCCSGSTGRRQPRGKGPDVMNTPYVGYERVNDPFQPADYGAGQQSGIKHMGYGGPMAQVTGPRQTPGAYEPYSHHV